MCRTTTNRSQVHQQSPDSEDQGTIICIGMTGMLADCTTKLLSLGYRIHLIARSPEGYAAQIDDSVREQLSMSACDYAQEEQLTHALRSAASPVIAVIGWIHSTAPNAWNNIHKSFPDADTLRVVGSSHHQVRTESNRERIVTLGFVVEGSGSRWLTHQEISEGVFDAFISGRAASIVGSIEPWSMKP
ncbi:MAG: hypothetical protein P1U30_03955 [Phycisphaerales bacterium]|nr:hypothetical protein [Phycisphaerales bacterium]